MQRTGSLILMLGIMLIALSPVFLSAQSLDPVSYEITEAPEEVQAGEVFEITVEASIEGEWHLYSIANDPDAGPFPTEFTSANDQLQIAGDIEENEPEIEHDPNFDTQLGWHTREAQFTVPLAFLEEAEGSTMIDLEVLYQVCDDKSCLPPKTKSITRSVSIEGVAEDPYRAENTGEDKQSSGAVAETELQEQEQTESVQAGGGFGGDGMLSFLWIALTAGLAALLTPCVFPMIPLTVSFFSKQEKQGAQRAVGSAVIFGLAIVLTFTVLGVLLAMVIGASGANQFAANPWVNLFIGAVLIIFAFSLLGMFELRLPHQLTNWLNRKSNESSGYIGILFMSFTISAVSFSCTAPFVGAVLAATTGGEWFYPIVGMLVFSAAFASPFVLFAMFPNWMESLPQSGSWMNLVKVLLGFVELAAAIKFISNADLVWNWGLISRPLAIAAWISIFFLAGLYILGTYALKHEEAPKQISTGRLLLSLPVFLFTFYLIPGLLGASLGIWDSWLPPRQATDVSVVYSISQQGGGGGADEFESWSQDYEGSLEKARNDARPVFVDFTGYTCTNCRAMESNVFPLQSVQEQFDKMEKVRLYTDDGNEGPANQELQFNLTGTVALPTYAIVDPASGKVIEQLVGYTDEERFTNFLQSGIEKYRSNSGGGEPSAGGL